MCVPNGIPITYLFEMKGDYMTLLPELPRRLSLRSTQLTKGAPQDAGGATEASPSERVRLPDYTEVRACSNPQPHTRWPRPSKRGRVKWCETTSLRPRG